jgi:response regulator NasT
VFDSEQTFVFEDCARMPARPPSLSILIIDENRLRASVIEEGLRDAGFTNLTIVHDVAGIARRIAETEPDVIVISLENPNRDMLENMFQLSRAVQRPIAMFVDRSDQATIEAAVEAGVSAYVVDGLKRERVKPILDMAISRFNAFSRMTRELEEARSELENRKLVDRAKGILMATRGLSEADAYALLRKTAMNQNRKISEIAESLITAAGLLAPPEDK